MLRYTDFIPQNVAPKNAKFIGVYDSSDHRVCKIPLGNLRFPNVGEKKYSFGALSDVHLGKEEDTNEHNDFQRALKYLNETENVDFICIAGDLTEAGITEQLNEYKYYIDTYSKDTTVYAITGNHESRNANIETDFQIANDFQTNTGKPWYYSFEHNGDVFIMVGSKGDTSTDGWSDEGGLFTKEELQWLYDTLEANRNKRCFVFQHVRPQNGCGNAFGIYHLDIWGNTKDHKEQTVFESLMTHYENAHHFHGHSHLKFNLQALTTKFNLEHNPDKKELANIDHIFGGWSIHIPSVSNPRYGDSSGKVSCKTDYGASEGYVVDVYENGIHLRGIDFVNGKLLPIASYWLDTTLQNVEENTYKDDTGTIVTQNQ